jgi:hypothetical protein
MTMAVGGGGVDAVDALLGGVGDIGEVVVGEVGESRFLSEDHSSSTGFNSGA